VRVGQIGLVIGAYRDARAGIAQRIADAEHAIEDLDARITPALSRMLPADVRTEIARLRAEPHAKDDSLEELTRVADSREALFEALRRAISLAPELEAHLRSPSDEPPTPPQDDTWGPIGTEESIVPTLESARAIASAIDADAVVSRVGARINARFHVRGVALLWCVELGMAVNMRSTDALIKFLSARHLVEIRVSDELPWLTIRPDTWVDDLLRIVQRSRGVKTGDDAFDRMLFVQGDAAFARPLLNGRVRAALLECAQAGAFTLALSRGLVTMRWREGLFDPRLDDRMPKRAAMALASLAESAAHLPLVARND
jgi:hypothetical protein